MTVFLYSFLNRAIFLKSFLTTDVDSVLLTNASPVEDDCCFIETSWGRIYCHDEAKAGPSKNRTSIPLIDL